MDQKILVAVVAIVIVAVVAVVLLSFGSSPSPSTGGGDQLVGGDKDEHGCIGSAGYSWCDAKQKCLRIWEEECNASNNGLIVGGDKDEHGCIGSAGYSWCEAKQKCLRVWEEECDTIIGGGTGMANPASVYCEQQGGTLEIQDTPDGQVGMCHFENGQVCEEWALFRSSGTNCTDVDGASARTYCQPGQRNAELCTMEYRQVCGWFDQTIQCFAYPCAQTYSNPCGACSNEAVAYWTEGECPAVGSSPGRAG